MTDVARNFAFPESDVSLEAQATILVSAHIAGLTRAIARALRKQGVNPALSDFLEAEHHRILGNHVAWCPEVGLARGFLNGERFSAAGAQLAILFSTLGIVTEWSALIEEETTFYVGGALVPLVGRVRGMRDGRGIKLTTNQSNDTTLHPSGGGRFSVLDQPTEYSPEDCRFEHSRLEDKYVMAVGGNLGAEDDSVDGSHHLFGLFAGAEADLAGYARDRIYTAYDLVDEVTPELSAYSRFLVRAFGAQPLHGGTHSSSSSTAYPGLILCTFPRSVDSLGETIVHEASHQYMNLLASVMPLAEKSEDAVYYSAIKGRKRTLRKHIIGYHAVANIVFFRRRLIQQLGSNALRRAELEKFEGFAVVMREELKGATGLTPVGRAFVDRLDEQLDNSVLGPAERAAAPAA